MKHLIRRPRGPILPARLHGASFKAWALGVVEGWTESHVPVNVDHLTAQDPWVPDSVERGTTLGRWLRGAR